MNVIKLRRTTPEDAEEASKIGPGRDIYYPNWPYVHMLLAIDTSSGDKIVGMFSDLGMSLGNLYVIPEYRRRGIATQMVQHVWDTRINTRTWFVRSAKMWSILAGIHGKLSNIGLYEVEIASAQYKCGSYCVYNTNPRVMGKTQIDGDNGAPYCSMWLSMP